MTKKAIGVPCHPRRFFKNLMDELPNNTKLYLSEFEGEAIGGGIMEYFGKKALYGYGAADPNRLQLHPYNAFLWKSIEDACNLGYQAFDFGRTSKDNAGLMSFKRKWGARESDLCYSSDRSVQTGLSRTSSAFRLGSCAMKYMPMSIYRGFSESIFNLLG